MSEAAVPWVKFRFDRWRADEGLSMCGLSARGLWIGILAIMHGCKPYGHLAIKGRPPTNRQIASMIGMTTEKEVVELLRELEEAGVFSRSDDGLIYCRRMVRDNAAREKGRAYGASGGNPNLTKQDNQNDAGRVNPIPSGGLTLPVKIEKREERREGETESIRRGSDDSEFDQFWALYPRKDAKLDARKAWTAARKLATAAEIIEGLRVYPFSGEPQYHKLPAGWLRDGRWQKVTTTAPVAQPQLTNDWNRF